MSAIHPANKIYVSGHHGMVGSAVCRALRRRGFENILTVGHENLDLTDQQSVFDFFCRRETGGASGVRRSCRRYCG